MASTALVQRDETLEDDIRPEARIGIAIGEVVIADGTLTGSDVVMAQRIEQLAEPGGICIQRYRLRDPTSGSAITNQTFCRQTDANRRDRLFGRIQAPLRNDPSKKYTRQKGYPARTIAASPWGALVARRP